MSKFHKTMAEYDKEQEAERSSNTDALHALAIEQTNSIREEKSLAQQQDDYLIYLKNKNII